MGCPNCLTTTRLVVSLAILLLFPTYNCIVQIDLSKPWIDQGPVDILIHKVTDFIAAADNGDLQAFKAVQKIEVVSIA